MQRVDYYSHFRPAFEKLAEVETLIKKSSLEPSLRHLVKLYVSQLNGCAFCVDMHSKEARIDGERELRLYHLSVWKESPLFSEKEKAALRWAEAVTGLCNSGVSDEVFDSVSKHFDDKELTQLTLAIGMINLWNRFGVSFQATPGAMDKALGLEKANLK